MQFVVACILATAYAAPAPGVVAVAPVHGVVHAAPLAAVHAHPVAISHTSS